MARTKPRKKTWPRMLVLFLAVPLALWLSAFLIWFYWYDLRGLFTDNERRGAAPKPALREPSQQRERQSSPPQEKIFEEDRKKLEDILKQRN